MFELKEIDTVSGIASPLKGKYKTLEGALEWAHHHADKWTEDEGTEAHLAFGGVVVQGLSDFGVLILELPVERA